jgi:hypothetical protein
MELLHSGLSQQSYRVGPPLPNLGEGFHLGFVGNHEVTLRLAAATDPEAVAALRAEAAMLERLQHRQVVNLLDRGRTEKSFFLVLDRPTERMLAELMNVVTFTCTAALDLMVQVLDILELLHSNGITWGWLHPQAFWVDQSGKLKLANLRGVGEAIWRGPTGLVEATYLAPERGDGQPPSVASDIYACGVLAYELLAGQAPFTGSTVTELVVKHLTEAPPDLGRRRADLPAELVEVIERCLAKTPFERPATVAELRDELQQIHEQLLADEWSQMVICPRCQNAVQPAERCPLCNAPLQEPEAPPPPTRRRRGMNPLLRIVGLAVIVGVLALPYVIGDENSDATASEQPSELVADFEETVEPLPPSEPTPMPTATVMPTPQGMLVLPAEDVVDPNIDIIRARAALEDDYVVTEIEVVGRIYEQINEATYQVFFDTDGDVSTGDRRTPWATLGADYAVLYRSGIEAGMVLGWDGAAWQGIGAATAEITDAKLRLQAPAAWFDNPQRLQYGALANHPGANLTDYAPARSENPAVVASTQ